MGLNLTVLGCCGSYPGPGGACSGYLVRGAGTTIWLDAGSGTLANLQRHVGLTEIDAVVLSHGHPDHWSDVEGLRVALTYVLEREGLPVFAPAGVRRLLSEDPAPALDWHEVADGARVEVGGLRLAFSRTEHPTETLAVRVDGDGRSLAYSADTGPGWSFDALGSGIDLALCDATFLRDREGRAVHLSARQAATMARRCQVGRLLLTHLWPTVEPARSSEEATAAYGAPVELARTHAEYEV